MIVYDRRCDRDRWRIDPHLDHKFWNTIAITLRSQRSWSRSWSQSFLIALVTTLIITIMKEKNGGVTSIYASDAITRPLTMALASFLARPSPFMALYASMSSGFFKSPAFIAQTTLIVHANGGGKEILQSLPSCSFVCYASRTLRAHTYETQVLISSNGCICWLATRNVWRIISKPTPKWQQTRGKLSTTNLWMDFCYKSIDFASLGGIKFNSTTVTSLLISLDFSFMLGKNRLTW